jgi:hypothetical protein
MAPREGGACDFPNRDNNMPLLFCWCRKPEFNLAVVDYVKSNIGSDCHNHTAQVKTQKTTDETNSSKQLTGRAKPQIKADKNI